MTSSGFGKHLWSLRDGDLTRVLRGCKHFIPYHPSNTLLTIPVYIAENIYVAVLAITKLSILAFYLRIFRHQKPFRTAVYTVGSLVILSTVVISILTIFQCHPIRYFWNRDLKGACLDVNALAYANSAMSIIQDVAIVALPIPVVWGLQMNTKKKVSVGIMFALGGL